MSECIPKVAVLLAAYNGEQWIDEQISSIIFQNNVCCDIYISVDLSSDNTFDHISERYRENKNIHLLSYGEKFGGAGQNFYRLIRDVDFSKYDYVALSDQDDIWMPEKLAQAILCINKRKYDAYSSNVLAFWDNGYKKIIKKSYTQKKYDHFFEAAGPGCTYVFKECALSRYKTFLIDNWDQVIKIKLHDWLIYAYFKENNLKWIISNDCFMFYRQHGNNQVGVNVGLKAYIKRVGQVANKSYRGEVCKIITLLNNNKFNLDTTFLLLNSFHLRRRLRDVLVLTIFVLLGIF